MRVAICRPCSFSIPRAGPLARARRELNQPPYLRRSRLSAPSGVVVGSAQAVHAQETWTTLPTITTSDTTGEKPQSKVWFHGHTWWAVLPTNAVAPTGTWLFRLEANNTWTPVLQLTSLKGKADTKAIGNLAHVSLQAPAHRSWCLSRYVRASNTYQLWSVTANSDIGLRRRDRHDRRRFDRPNVAGHRNLTFVEVYTAITPIRHSRAPSIWRPTRMAANQCGRCTTEQHDWRVLVEFPNERFGFRVHVDGTDPTVWLADEMPAASFHPNQQMADDHMNLAVSADGTVYASVKAAHASSSIPLIYLLVRHPQPGGPGGTWDDIYQSVAAARARSWW